MHEVGWRANCGGPVRQCSWRRLIKHFCAQRYPGRVLSASCKLDPLPQRGGVSLTVPRYTQPSAPPSRGGGFFRSLHQALVSDVRSGRGSRRPDPRRLRWKRDSTCPRHNRRRDHSVLTTGIITGSVQQKQAKRASYRHDGGNAHGSQILLVLGHGGRSSPECLLGGIVSARKG